MPPLEKDVLKPWYVFIIDDSPDDRAEVRRMLLKGSDRQLRFFESQTAADGIKAVLAAKPPPDCVVLDYNLPDMDAPEVLEALSGPDGMPVCPVVVLTGGSNREDGRRVLRAGAHGYISKDWTSPHALSGALENASESWMMGLELRQHRDALRVVNDREAFRSAFGDATRNLTDEPELRRVATLLLGAHLGANRLFYAEMIDEERVVVEPGYVSDVQPIDGIYRVQDYGPNLMERIRAGENIVVSDIRQSSDYSTSEKLAYTMLEIAAKLLVPILKSDRLVAIMGVHQKYPRVWTQEDIGMAREIAERTWAALAHARSEEKLRTNEQQLSLMLKIMPSFSAVLTGPTFVFQRANQSYFDLVGRGSEIIGLPVLEALPEIANQPFPALLDEVYRTGIPFHTKSMVAKLPRGAGGSLTDVFIDFAYLPLMEADGGVSGIFIHGVDRTAEAKASEVLARREREIRSVTENTPDVLTRFDRQFRHIFVNSVIEKITGQSVADILGKTTRELNMPDPLSEQWEQAISHVFDHGEDRSLEFCWPTLRGIRHFSSHLVPEFNERGQVESVLAVTHDVTDRRIYEQQLLEQDQRKDEFLATLAHELRNPLAPIRTGLQVLKLTPDAEAAARTLPVMERQLGQLVKLVDDLLDVSRISNGKIVLRRERIAFQDVAAAALEASRPVIDAARHSLVIDLPNQLVWLDADATRITQILSNLLTNSAKYMHPGGHIKLSARQQGNHILISVADKGMGIPADVLGSVFDMFTQVNRTLDRAQGGMGIGLSLVKKLVEMHGGWVHAASGGVDQGSEFTVNLPIAATAATDMTENALHPANCPQIKYRILVVDDNVDATETMTLLLDLSGHDVRPAYNGQEALEVAFSFRPDIVFLDIGLPDMNGYEVARSLLAHPATASTKLIALTGWGTEEDIRRSEMAGFHAHLTKPVDPEAIEAIVLNLLSVRRAGELSQSRQFLRVSG